jgi:hypothetical protein
MSKNILLITPATIKERTGLHNNVDEKLVFPVIKMCQDMFIEPALGSALYARVQAGIGDNNLTSDETTLLDDYITDCLSWFVLAKLPVNLAHQFYSKGVMQKRDDGADPISASDILRIESENKNNAEFYLNKLIKFLKKNYATYPTYKSETGDADDVIPEDDGYSCPIYLDDE